jgi:DNA mismatch repair ATPase MutS
MPDLDLIRVKLSGKGATLEDLVRVYEGVVAVNCVVDDLKQADSSVPTVHEMFIIPLEKVVGQLEGFMRLIETTIDIPAASSGTFRIDAKFDASLGELATRRAKILNDMEKLRASVSRKTGMFASLIVSNRMGWGSVSFGNQCRPFKV